MHREEIQKTAESQSNNQPIVNNQKRRLRHVQVVQDPRANQAGRKLTMKLGCVQISQQLYYRVTRSGRVYGLYSCPTNRVQAVK